MITFKELIENLEEQLTAAGRRKLSRSMKKNQSKIQRGRRKSMRKAASQDTIKRRSKQRANRQFYSKSLKGRSKSSLSHGEKKALELKRKNRSGQIQTVAKRLKSKTRKDDRSRARG